MTDSPIVQTEQYLDHTNVVRRQVDTPVISSAQSPLDRAYAIRRYRAAELFLDLGAEPSIVALEKACLNHQIRALSIMLLRFKSVDIPWSRLLFRAFQYNKVAQLLTNDQNWKKNSLLIIEELLEGQKRERKNLPPVITDPQGFGFPALCYAIKLDVNDEGVSLILRYLTIEQINEYSEMPLLHFCILFARRNIFRLLAENGADLKPANRQDSEGPLAGLLYQENCLHMCALQPGARESREISQMALGYAAPSDFNAPSAPTDNPRPGTPLQYALMSENLWFAKALLRGGADKNHVVPSMKSAQHTALGLVTELRVPWPEIQTLFEVLFDPELGDASASFITCPTAGHCILSQAAVATSVLVEEESEECDRIFEYLLQKFDKDDQVNYVNPLEKSTPLMVAITSANDFAVDKLLERGASLDALWGDASVLGLALDTLVWANRGLYGGNIQSLGRKPKKHFRNKIYNIILNLTAKSARFNILSPAHLPKRFNNLRTQNR